MMARVLLWLGPVKFVVSLASCSNGTFHLIDGCLQALVGTPEERRQHPQPHFEVYL